MSRSGWLAALVAVALGGSAAAQPDNAQALLFETPHLDGLNAGQTLTYRFEGYDLTGKPLSDSIAAHIDAVAADGRKTVSFEYFTGDHRLDVPQAERFRGNPLLMYFLERDVGLMRRRSGAPTAYLGQRIREALAAAEVAAVTITVDGASLTAREITLQPFAQDPQLAAQPYFAERIYRFVVAPELPGELFLLSVEGPTAPTMPEPQIETVTFTGIDG
jgi:hypothetical protein